MHHPPLKGEGRTAEGSPGWGDSGATPPGRKLRRRRHPLPARWRGPTSPLQGEGKAHPGLRAAETAHGELNTINWSVTCPEPGLSEPPARETMRPSVLAPVAWRPA